MEHNHNPELLTAVKERVELGYTNEQIHGELRAAGYDDATIDDVLQLVKNGVADIPPAHRASQPLIAYSQLLRDTMQLVRGERTTFFRGFCDLGFTLIGLCALVLAVVGFIGIDDVKITLTLPAEGMPDITAVVLFLGLLFLLLVVFGLVAKMISFAVKRKVLLRNEQPEPYLKSLKWSFRHIFSIFWLAILVSLVTQLGYALLLFPGIALAIYLVFANYFLATDKAKGIPALIASMELVYGRWWSVFGRLLMVGFMAMVYMSLLMMLLCGAGIFLYDMQPLVGIVVTMVGFMVAVWVGYAFALAGGVLVYESLQRTKTMRFSAKTTGQLRTGLIVAAVLGLALSLLGNATEDGSLLEEFQAAQSGAEVASLSAELHTLAASAEVYFGQTNGSYEGVCAELLAQVRTGEQSDCIDRTDRWAFSAATPRGDRYCIDSDAHTVVPGPLQAAAARCEQVSVTPVDNGRNLKDWAQQLRTSGE